MSRIRFSHGAEGEHLVMKAEATAGGKDYAIKRYIHPLEAELIASSRFLFFRHEAKMLRGWIRHRIDGAG